MSAGRQYCVESSVAAAGSSKRPRRPMFDLGGQTEPRGPGQQWLDRVALEGYSGVWPCVSG